MIIRPDTMQLVKAQRPAGFVLTGDLLRLGDGSWLIAVSDVVVVRVASERVPGESDDGVVSRLLQEPRSQPLYPNVAARQSL
jgi:hypothetical protein